MLYGTEQFYYYSIECNNLQNGVAVNAESRQNPCGKRPLKLTASSGTIKSPGYDQSTYDNDAYCSWLIEAPAGNVRHSNRL